MIFVATDQGDMSGMNTATTVAMTVFLGACVGGMYLYEFYNKHLTLEGRLQQLEHVVRETTTEQANQHDVLECQELKIQDKKDYDKRDELDEGTYQAWKGQYIKDTLVLNIVIYRKKFCSYKKNEDWEDWNGAHDASVVVRDFYLGNSHPDFHWTIKADTDCYFQARLQDTLINGWDSTIEIDINIMASSDKEITEDQSFSGNSSLNAFLKKIMDDNKINWSRILITA